MLNKAADMLWTRTAALAKDCSLITSATAKSTALQLLEHLDVHVAVLTLWQFLLSATSGSDVNQTSAASTGAGADAIRQQLLQGRHGNGAIGEQGATHLRGMVRSIQEGAAQAYDALSAQVLFGQPCIPLMLHKVTTS